MEITAELKNLIDEAGKQIASTVKSYSQKVEFNENETNKEALNLANEAKDTVVFFKSLILDGDLKKATEIGNKYAIKALQTTTTGAALVPTTFAKEIITKQEDYSLIRKLANTFQQTSKSINMNEVSTKPLGYIVGEGAAVTDSNITFGESTATLRKYGVSHTSTFELLRFSEIDILDTLAKLFAEAMAKVQEDQFVNGVVAGSEGILTKTGVTGISLISGNTFGAITWDDLANMQAALANVSMSEVNNATFLMSFEVYNHLRKTKATTSGIYHLPLLPTLANPAVVDGVKIIIINSFPKTTAVSTKFVALTDWKSHLFIGDYPQIEVNVNTSGTAASGVNLNSTGSKELTMFGLTSNVIVAPSGVVTLATNA